MCLVRIQPEPLSGVALILFHKNRTVSTPCQTCWYLNAIPTNCDYPDFPGHMATITLKHLGGGGGGEELGDLNLGEPLFLDNGKN